LRDPFCSIWFGWSSVRIYQTVYRCPHAAFQVAAGTLMSSPLSCGRPLYVGGCRSRVAVCPVMLLRIQF
jgi:hypothetical protein